MSQLRDKFEKETGLVANNCTGLGDHSGAEADIEIDHKYIKWLENKLSTKQHQYISGTHFATSNRAEGYYFVQPFESRPYEIRYYRDGQMYDNQHCRNGAVPAGLYHMVDPNVIVLPVEG